MAGSIFKEIIDFKNKIVESAAHGFLPFIQNVTLIAMIAGIIFAVTNEDFIRNPIEFLSTSDFNFLWSLAMIFIAICIVYRLAVILNSSIREKNNDVIVQRVVDDIETSQMRKKQKNEEEHNALIEKRFQAGPIIRSELKDLLITLGATRASICEMHNGTNNLSGIPFLYLDMTYEEISPSKVQRISDEYKNFNMAKFPFVSSHVKDCIWFGSLEEVEREDPYLASKFKFADSNYGAFVVIRGTHSMIGLLTVTFKDTTNLPERKEIISAISITAQVISTLLDKDV